MRKKRFDVGSAWGAPCGSIVGPGLNQFMTPRPWNAAGVKRETLCPQSWRDGPGAEFKVARDRQARAGGPGLPDQMRRVGRALIAGAGNDAGTE